MSRADFTGIVVAAGEGSRFADPLPSSTTNTAGIVFDMDLVGFDDRINGDLTPIDASLGEVEYPQDVFGDNGTSEVSLMGRSDYLQEPPLESPFENIVGSQLDDIIEIDPLYPKHNFFYLWWRELLY